MRFRFWHPWPVKRLEIGDMSGPRLAMIVGLILVIALSIGMVVWVFLGGGETSKDSPDSDKTEFAQGVPHQCAACKHEFGMTSADFTKFQKDIDRASGGLSRLPHCPKCGARHSAVVMTPCPQCGKRYVPYGAEVALATARGQEHPAGAKNICPHCDTDVDAYRREKSRR